VCPGVVNTKYRKKKSELCREGGKMKGEKGRGDWVTGSEPHLSTYFLDTFIYKGFIVRKL